MSLMDDMFDLHAALEGTDEEKALDRLINYLNLYEQRLEELMAECEDLRATVRVLTKMGNEE